MISFLSAFFGGIIAGTFAIFAVEQGKFQEEKNALLGLLIKQRYDIRMSDHTTFKGQINEQYPNILIAYNRLLSVSPFFLKNRIKGMWRNYKGDFEDYIGLFGSQHTQTTAPGCYTTSNKDFSKEEIEEKIDEFTTELKKISGFLSALPISFRKD